MPYLYQVYNITAGDVTIDDLPTPITAGPKTTTTLAPNSFIDIVTSLILKDRLMASKLEFLVNGKGVNLLAILETQSRRS